MAYLESAPFQPLLHQLESRVALSAEDRRAIMALPFVLRTINPGSYLLREGEPARGCAVLLTGFVIRHKLTGDGHRQIVALHIPGDPLDLEMLFLDAADHNVQTLTRATIAVVPRGAVEAAMAEHPGIARAITVNMLAEASIAREWLLSNGRRDARARLAHLLCEFAARMDAQGIGDGGTYDLPMTQEQIGDALGLTSVHVNRTLRALETEGQLRRLGRRISFTHKDEIGRIGDFDPRYLHFATIKPAVSDGYTEPDS
jgi:CRP-like cAMP-binding protein